MKLDRFLQISIAVLFCVFVYVLFVSMYEHVVVVGDSAPDFSITADNGRTVSAGNFGGKLLVLNFWATWCPPCINEIPSLDQFQKLFASSGVVVLGVSVDKDEQVYKRFLSRAKVSFMTARDPGNKINAEYGTFKFPETYLINSDGKVVMKVINETDWTAPKMLDFVKSLL